MELRPESPRPELLLGPKPAREAVAAGCAIQGCWQAALYFIVQNHCLGLKFPLPISGDAAAASATQPEPGTPLEQFRTARCQVRAIPASPACTQCLTKALSSNLTPGRAANSQSIPSTHPSRGSSRAVSGKHESDVRPRLQQLPSAVACCDTLWHSSCTTNPKAGISLRTGQTGRCGVIANSPCLCWHTQITPVSGVAGSAGHG